MIQFLVDVMQIWIGLACNLTEPLNPRRKNKKYLQEKTCSESSFYESLKRRLRHRKVLLRWMLHSNEARDDDLSFSLNVLFSFSLDETQMKSSINRIKITQMHKRIPAWWTNAIFSQIELTIIRSRCENQKASSMMITIVDVLFATTPHRFINLWVFADVAKTSEIQKTLKFYIE